MAKLYINVEGATEAPCAPRNDRVVYAKPPMEEDEEEPYISPHDPSPLRGSYVVEESYIMLDQVYRWYLVTDTFSKKEMRKHIESFVDAMKRAIDQE